MLWEPVTVAVWKMASLPGLHCCVRALREFLYTAHGSLANATMGDCADCAAWTAQNHKWTVGKQARVFMQSRSDRNLLPLQLLETPFPPYETGVPCLLVPIFSTCCNSTSWCQVAPCWVRISHSPPQQPFYTWYFFLLFIISGQRSPGLLSGAPFVPHFLFPPFRRPSSTAHTASLSH